MPSLRLCTRDGKGVSLFVRISLAPMYAQLEQMDDHTFTAAINRWKTLLASKTGWFCIIWNLPYLLVCLFIHYIQFFEELYFRKVMWISGIAPHSHWACMAFRLCHCAIILYTPSSIFTVDYLFFIMYHLTYIVQVKNVNTCNIFGFFWSYIIREVTMTQWECYSIAKYGMWAEFEPLRPLASSVALFWNIKKWRSEEMAWRRS